MISIPGWAAIAARLAPLVNLLQSVPGRERIAGISAKRSLPKWRRDPFVDRVRTVSGRREVVLFVDTFNRWFEPENTRAALRVLVFPLSFVLFGLGFVIGLFRSELLFLKNSGHAPEMQDQLETYSMLAREMSPYPVAVRTLDGFVDALGQAEIVGGKGDALHG